MPENQKPKLNKFSLQTEVAVYSSLNALQIAKNLKLGLWFENEEKDYVDGETVFTNLKITNLEVTFDELVKSEEVPCFSVRLNATFESEMNEETAKEKTVVYFGKESSSLQDENGEYLIEHVDYLDFLLVQEEDEIVTNPLQVGKNEIATEFIAN